MKIETAEIKECLYDKKVFSWSYKIAKLGAFYAQNVVRQKFTNFFFTKNTAPKHEEVDKR